LVNARLKNAQSFPVRADEEQERLALAVPPLSANEAFDDP